MRRNNWRLVKASATAKAQGELARRLGLTRSHCPYSYSRAVLREAWLEGYDERAREVALAKHFATLESKRAESE